jgi:uncharacterized damage-inducible protein DinB
MRGWEVHQDRLAATIAGLELDQLRLRAAPDLWSIQMLAAHVVAARAWWFHGWMGEAGEELARLDAWDDDEGLTDRTGAELAGGLERTWAVIADRVASWSATDLEREFQRPTLNADGERPLRSRLWIIWHLVEHDLHHGGEISFSLGMHGIPGLDL